MAGRGVVFVLIAGFLALLPFGWISAQEDTMILGNKDIFKKLERPPVTFNHGKHAEKYPDCVECHHVYEYKDGKKENTWSGESQRCSECHKLKQDGKKRPLREAYHGLCTGCHRKLTKEGEKSGPVTCGQCHVKTKRQ